MAAPETRAAAVLGRQVVDLGEARFAAYLEHARVLVTGAGGSLGRELCRRLMALGVGSLVLLDQAEAPLAEVHDELSFETAGARTIPVLADLRAPQRVRAVLSELRPSIVFHTAAYKVVPLVEAHPLEAIATNVLSTRTLADAAVAERVDRFVLFTTDKAIRPSSVLGKTKAAAECIVGTAARAPGETRFACIRLGNVIDSAGSILPLFRRRLAARRPVSVTDARMTRYFMTAGEAAALAIVAGGLAGRGEVFRLDMGAPVRVLDAARMVVAATGNGTAPPIEFVGLRPGEKLHEELDAPGEVVCPTGYGGVLRGGARHADPRWLEQRLARLRVLVETADAGEARRELARLVDGIRVGDGIVESPDPA